MITRSALLLAAGATVLASTPTLAQDAVPALQAADGPGTKSGDDYHDDIIVTASGLKRLDLLAGTSVMSGEELQRTWPDR